MGYELTPDNALFSDAKDSGLSAADLEIAKPQEADFDLGSEGEDDTNFSSTDFNLSEEDAAADFAVDASDASSDEVGDLASTQRISADDELLSFDDIDEQAGDDIGDDLLELPDDIGDELEFSMDDEEAGDDLNLEDDLDLAGGLEFDPDATVDDIEATTGSLEVVSEDQDDISIDEDTKLEIEATTDNLKPVSEDQDEISIGDETKLEIEATTDNLKPVSEDQNEISVGEETELEILDEDDDEVVVLGLDESSVDDDLLDLNADEDSFEVDSDDDATAFEIDDDIDFDKKTETIMPNYEDTEVVPMAVSDDAGATDDDPSEIDLGMEDTTNVKLVSDDDDAAGDAEDVSIIDFGGDDFDEPTAVIEVDADDDVFVIDDDAEESRTGTFAPGDFDEPTELVASIANVDDIDDLMLPEDVDEVSTKLDLARAFIDMGDTEGARGSLEEVMSEGNAEQKVEAKALLDQI